MAQHVGPLVLIDGHNTFIRNYVRSPYMDTNGQRAGGTTGMVVSVRKIIKDFNPSNVLVVWDGEGGSQRRRTIYSAYKEGRKVRLNEEYDFDETPEDRLDNMRKQRNHASELLTLLGVPQVRADAVEADDLIAYIAGKMDHPHGVIIVSTDRDFLQLIKKRDWNHNCLIGYDEHIQAADYPDMCARCRGMKSSEVRVFSPVKKVMYDHDRFISEFGVLPENFGLVKALMGDASDNIEGIKGFGVKVGPKTFPILAARKTDAAELLELGAGLDGILGKRLIEEKSRFLENLKLMDLSDPMLSATAARQARDALKRDAGCKELDFRMRVVRDGISFSGNDFISPFRELVLRRRKHVVVPVEAEADYVGEQVQVDEKVEPEGES